MPCVKVTAYHCIEASGENNLSISDRERGSNECSHSTLFNLPDKIGSHIRSLSDACYLSNSSEQEEILEITAIYEAICDPLPSLPLPFFFRRKRSGPPGDIRPTTNPFTTRWQRKGREGGEHAPPLKFKARTFSTQTMEMDCTGDGCQGRRHTLGFMDEDREEDDMCNLSERGISWISFLTLVLQYGEP